MFSCKLQTAEKNTPVEVKDEKVVSNFLDGVPTIHRDDQYQSYRDYSKFEKKNKFEYSEKIFQPIISEADTAKISGFIINSGTMPTNEFVKSCKLDGDTSGEEENIEFEFDIGNPKREYFVKKEVIKKVIRVLYKRNGFYDRQFYHKRTFDKAIRIYSQIYHICKYQFTDISENSDTST